MRLKRGGGFPAVLSMFKRCVTLSPEVLAFLGSFDSRLLRAGIAPRVIEEIAAQIIGWLFISAPKGTFVGAPRYLMRDELRKDWSVYEFSESLISGRYSSSPDEVYVIFLEFSPPVLGLIEQTFPIRRMDVA